jgi:hypothetical protein
MRTAIHHPKKNRYHFQRFITGLLQGVRPFAGGPVKSIPCIFWVSEQHLATPPSLNKPVDTLTEDS